MSDPYRWSAAARAIREEAARRARALGHPRVDAVHLLLAALATPGPAAEILEAAGVQAEALAALAAQLDEGPLLAGPAPADSAFDTLREIAETAEEIADLEAAVEVQPLHVLLAATEDPEGSAVQALRRLGVDVVRLRDRVRARLADHRS